jgi:hypothetical protein
MAFSALPSAHAARCAPAARAVRAARATPAALSAPRRARAAARASYRLYTAAELRADEAPAASTSEAAPAEGAAPASAWSPPVAAPAVAAAAGEGTFLTAPQELMNGAVAREHALHCRARRPRLRARLVARRWGPVRPLLSRRALTPPRPHFRAGRAAMAGFVIAVATELATGQGVLSQVFSTVTQSAYAHKAVVASCLRACQRALACAPC